MPLFGRKKKEESTDSPMDELPLLNSLDQAHFTMEQSTPQLQPIQPLTRKEPEKPTAAPLFVKIERYRQILTTIGNLKTALVIVKNSLGTLDQIEKVRNQTMGIVNDIVSKMDDKLIDLDNNLLRPAGFHETNATSPEQQDIRSIEATVSDLQGQIEQLKSELSKVVI